MADVHELDGQWAVVTGASSGIGEAIAGRFAEAGANVVVVARGRERLDKVADELRTRQPPGREAHGIATDIGDPQSIAHLFDEVRAIAPTLNVFVANAGVGSASSFVDLSLEEWRGILDVNLTGTFLTCQAAARLMMEAGPAEGRNQAILAVSSVRANSTLPGRLAYATSKAGLNQMIRVAARELAASGIRANVLAPGITSTTLTTREDQRPLFEEAARQVPLGRATDTSDLAEAALYLCSARGGFVTGANLAVDGGEALI
jgi:3-oxoacyl-[acyl-carrier protein] reductase